VRRFIRTRIIACSGHRLSLEVSGCRAQRIAARVNGPHHSDIVSAPLHLWLDSDHPYTARIVAENSPETQQPSILQIKMIEATSTMFDHHVQQGRRSGHEGGA
jgi:hypothetical protein